MSNSPRSSGPAPINPSTGIAGAPVRWLGDTEIETALAAAARAARAWGSASLAERATTLRTAAHRLRQDRTDLARTISLEMGKPLVEAEGEIDKSAWNCEFVAEQAPLWLADENVSTGAKISYVAARPLGVVLAILPWNFPVWQVFRCAVAALMAGNVMLLKHAPNVPESARKVTQLLEQSGLPPGVFQNLQVPVDRIAKIIFDPRVAAVTLTGSPAAGAAVAALAGAACKKSILELGGSDAFIVLEDADLDTAIPAAVKARFTNCGQVCLAAKRFIVIDSVWGEFAERMREAIAALRVGNPLDRSVQMGPMARGDLRDALDRQIRESVSRGARLVTGGHALDEPGFYYAPTLMFDTDASMPVVSEETFGPVAPLLKVRSADEALQLANQSRYGLAGILWTRDMDRARALAARMEVGGVFINAVTASDPRLPVGGVKLSGYGRELGAAGVRELVNLQSVWIGP